VARKPARRGRASERVSRVHVDTAGPMAIVLAGEREYGYVVVGDYSRAVYRRPLRLKPAVDVFTPFRVAAENESERRIREIMMDNARELSMGKMHDIRERDGPSCTPSPAPQRV